MKISLIIFLSVLAFAAAERSAIDCATVQKTINDKLNDIRKKNPDKCVKEIDDVLANKVGDKITEKFVTESLKVETCLFGAGLLGDDLGANIYGLRDCLKQGGK